jgi:hypothetical protein
MFKLISAAGILGALIAGYSLYRHVKYPYGWSHSCDKTLLLALQEYAEDHGGAFPAGESSSEASLSLLYPKYVHGDLEYASEILRGKTISKEIVKDRLSKGERLSPKTCGWHYVEGLRTDDDGRLALVWDKIGLGHNGERLPRGGHWVVFVNTSIEYIPECDWDAFVKEQERLILAQKERRRQKKGEKGRSTTLEWGKTTRTTR